MQSAGGGGQAVRRRRSPLPRTLRLVAPLGLIAAAAVALCVSGHRGVSRPSMALRAVADVSSNDSSFTYVPGGEGLALSGRQYHRGAPGLLTLSVYGMPPAPGGTSATIYVDLSNGTGHTAAFVDGPHVAVVVTHDAKPYRELTLTQPAALALAPDGVLSLQASVPLAGAGTYGLSAGLVGQGGNPAFTLEGAPTGP
jgi:hypothetical protein